jgi:hypothetical protein
MHTLKTKREKARKFQEDERNFFDVDLPNKLDKFYSNISRVDQNRYESSAEKVRKLSARNRYADNKHNEMNQKFADDAERRY